MDKTFDPESDELKETWNLSITYEDVKELCENLEKLNLETNQESDNSESSTETVIENKRRKSSPEKKRVKNYPNPMLLFLPFQGERSLVSSIPLEWWAKLSSILQWVQKTAKLPLKIRQESTDTEHKSYMKKTVNVRTAT